MRIKSALQTKRIILFLLLVGIILAAFFWLSKDILPALPGTSSNTKTSNENQKSQLNKNLHSVDDSSSLWAVVNKGRILPSDYLPTELVTPDVPLRFSRNSPEMKLRNDAAKALEELFSKAKKNNLQPMLVSAYRSYAAQGAIYSRNLKSDGQTITDATSARAGHSEHQTGLAVDIGTSSRICELEKCFASTAEGKWLKNNSHRFGYVLRYSEGKQNLTGYDFEPWHFRYIGVELAQELHQSDQTMESFFGLPANPVYPLEIIKLNP